MGKAAKYKQIRCINQAKRGMIALNVEWFGMGQLRTDGFVHERMNQIDLCGSSGLAPFYLAMKRGLDVLLSQEHADPECVAVTGLSGGGWQTIFISALDMRVTLTDPVAGYSSFKTRRAPRQRPRRPGADADRPGDPRRLHTPDGDDGAAADAADVQRERQLLFRGRLRPAAAAARRRAGLPPLRQGREPALSRQPLPGTHAYEKDNREAFYRMVSDFFYPDDVNYDFREIPCDAEIKTKEQLSVEIPADNLDFHALALRLSKALPRNGEFAGRPCRRREAAKGRPGEAARNRAG